MIALLSRSYGKKQTTGAFTAYDGDKKIFECVTLEPQSNNNEENNSCINIGDYWVSKHNSPKFGKCFLVEGTIDRTHILFHALNYRRETHGCIGPGESFSDIDGDGLKDVVHSNHTLSKMLELLPDRFMMLVR